MPRTRVRSTPIAPAACAGAIRAPTCGTFMRRTRCWRKSWIRSTTSVSTLTPCGGCGILFNLGKRLVFLLISGLDRNL